LSAIQNKKVNAALDISDGGLAVALAEMAIFSGKGAAVTVDALGNDKYEVLYSEAQSGVVVTCPAAQQDELESHFSDRDVPFEKLGTVGLEKDDLKIGELFTISVDEMRGLYEGVIEGAMAKK